MVWLFARMPIGSLTMGFGKLPMIIVSLSLLVNFLNRVPMAAPSKTTMECCFVFLQIKHYGLAHYIWHGTAKINSKVFDGNVEI